MKRALSLVVAILVSACATVGGPAVPPAARAELAPTGTLRVGLIAVNPIFVTQNTPAGETRGIAIDIANRLADRIGVSMKPVLYPSVGSLMAAAGKGEWDITLLPINPERATMMNFTAPYMYSESTFLVPANSAARGFEDLDRAGKTLVAVSRSTEEEWLRANARSATIVTASSPVAAREMMKEGKVDAYASVTANLHEASRQVPGSRVLAGSFRDAPIAMAVIKVRPSADAFASEFIDQLNASGVVGEWIAREKLVGVRAAK
jgi:polar amino acid transport system substrate-binding protein